MAEGVADSLENKAKKYSNIKYSLTIAETLYSLILLFLFLSFGISKSFVSGISELVPLKVFILPVYLLALSVIYYFLDFPFNIYHSYILEHKFALTNQKIGDWFKDQLKGFLLSFVISIICLAAFYYILNNFTDNWWLIISLFWIFFSLILAKLMPVVIIPLFFKYKKLSDQELRQRIMNLASKMKVKILDVFEIDFSKKTLKANAAFVGWGSTRRVLLADTLKDKYSLDEIEVILAHEFAHYKLKHLLKLIMISASVTIISFYLIFRTNSYFIKLVGLSSLADFAALPVILIYFIIVGIVSQPLENYISRVFEANADKTALKTTGLKDAFISAMDKLASQNLADRKPHPLIKFFFFSHPPIDERINLAKLFSIEQK